MNALELAERFEAEFRMRPQVFSAPGRVNLIGEHTDYNDGFVLPSAIGFYTRVAAAGRPEHILAIRSTQLPESHELDLTSLPKTRLGKWCDYVLGVAIMLQRAGCPLVGSTLLVDGEVPIGAGLSSSAAIEVATALALSNLAGKKLPLPELAKLCQKAENEFVGARVGIMDQFVSCLAKEGHALLLDCRSLDFKLVPIPTNVKLVICNTMVKHELSAGEYNRRRGECEQGVEILSTFYDNVHALRDVSRDQLRAHCEALPPLIYRRCLHVVEENRRVQDTVRCLRSDDLPAVGRLMRESHRSLRDLYEVSCPELDIMVEAAEGLPGYIGGRMTGGGFGGCTVNLVEAAHAEAFVRVISERYRQKTSIVPETYVCTPANGAGIELDR
jgi:galactokinase